MANKTKYLGHGIHVNFNGFSIVMTFDNSKKQIYLENTVLTNFFDFYKQECEARLKEVDSEIFYKTRP